jgi:DNA-directed RNA polymerase subunit RPC12/RpoP
VDLSNTYEEEIKCPACGAKLSMRVKTKGKVPEAQEKNFLIEKKKERRQALIMFIIGAAIGALILLLTDFSSPAGTLITFLCIAGLITGVLFSFGLFFFIRDSVWLSSRERLVKAFDRKHPYMVSITQEGRDPNGFSKLNDHCFHPSSHPKHIDYGTEIVWKEARF